MSRAELYDNRFARTMPLQWEISVLKSHLNARGKTLDVGCGTGRLLLPLEQEGFGLIGVDIDKEFVEAARNKLQNESLDTVLIVADARRLPFRDSVFDCVFSTGNVLGEVNAREIHRSAMLEEMARVIEPNGTIAIEFVHRYWNLKDLFSWLWRYVTTALKKIRGASIEYGDYDETYQIDNKQVTLTFHAFTTREAEKLLRNQKLTSQVIKKGLFFHDWFFVVGRKVAD